MRREQRAPAGDRKRILAPHRKIRAGQMQLRQRLAERRAMRGARLARPHAVEKGDDRRRPAGEPVAARLPARFLTGCGQVMPGRARCSISPRKNGRSLLGDALLVQRQDEMPAVGMQQEIGILDALGDALVGRQARRYRSGEKPQFVGRDIGIDRHGRYYAASGRSERGSGKNSFSSAAETVSTCNS